MTRRFFAKLTLAATIVAALYSLIVAPMPWEEPTRRPKRRVRTYRLS